MPDTGASAATSFPPWPVAVLRLASWFLFGLSALALVGVVIVRLATDNLPYATVPALAGLLAALGSICVLLVATVIAFLGRAAEARRAMMWSCLSLLLYAILQASMWLGS